jgi:hypothetical protein
MISASHCEFSVAGCAEDEGSEGGCSVQITAKLTREEREAEPTNLESDARRLSRFPLSFGPTIITQVAERRAHSKLRRAHPWSPRSHYSLQ